MTCIFFRVGVFSFVTAAGGSVLMDFAVVSVFRILRPRVNLRSAPDGSLICLRGTWTEGSVNQNQALLIYEYSTGIRYVLVLYNFVIKRRKHWIGNIERHAELGSWYFRLVWWLTNG